MQGLNGKFAVVSGASRGIGKSIALRLVSEGVSVFITAEVAGKELEQSRDDCAAAAAHGAKALAGVYDLSRDEAAEEMIAGALEAFGRVDILVNNAGIRNPGLFGEFTHADFDSAFAVNLRAPFFASQAVIPSMKRNGGGRIIHISSQHGLVASPHRGLYGTTKAGLAYLAKAMAVELSQHNILVNAVSPGPIASEAFLKRAEDDPEFLRQRLSYIPLGRVGQPEDVASAVAFLASDEACFIQGHNLVVDGGFVVH
ncbi:MAG: SDR family NAD(P)-dependent oxidoreductase [Hyphomicrobiales bacterium]